MSVSFQLTRSLFDGAARLSSTETLSWGGNIEIDEAIPTPSTNLAFTFAFTKTKLKAIYIIADQDLTLYTNAASTGSPQETIVLVAGRAMMWSSTDPLLVNPFAGNVTALYVTNASGVAATLRVRVLFDPT